MTHALALLLFAAGPAPAPVDPSLTLPPEEQLKQARATYEYGNYGSAIDQLEKLTNAHRLGALTDQEEAYRLLGLADFFSNHNDNARRAFLNLLSLEPDFQLDPLYVPPQAIAFFEQVRRENKVALDPIRARKRATQEAIKQEEEARRRLLAQVNSPPSQIVHERIDRASPILALLPFGAGQFQNGNVPLGVVFAAGEGAALITSAVCFGLVLSLANADGYYSPANYATANTLKIVQLATGAGFGLAWALGAGEALWHLRPPIVKREDQDNGGSEPLGPKLSGSVVPLPGGGVGSLALTF